MRYSSLARKGLSLQITSRSIKKIVLPYKGFNPDVAGQVPRGKMQGMLSFHILFVGVRGLNTGLVISEFACWHWKELPEEMVENFCMESFRGRCEVKKDCYCLWKVNSFITKGKTQPPGCRSQSRKKKSQFCLLGMQICLFSAVEKGLMNVTLNAAN